MHILKLLAVTLLLISCKNGSSTELLTETQDSTGAISHIVQGELRFVRADGLGPIRYTDHSDLGLWLYAVQKGSDLRIASQCDGTEKQVLLKYEGNIIHEVSRPEKHLLEIGEYEQSLAQKLGTYDFYLVLGFSPNKSGDKGVEVEITKLTVDSEFSEQKLERDMQYKTMDFSKLSKVYYRNGRSDGPYTKLYDLSGQLELTRLKVYSRRGVK